MKDNLSLDDLALFLAVADAGGLTGAVRSTGKSAPTLSRHMAELERRLDSRLFVRGARGYSLTREGRALVAECEPLRGLASRVAAFGAEAGRRSRVRITAGTWTARFLAQHLSGIWSDKASWVPEFMAVNTPLDIARRAADIGIRNARPDQSWLAGRRTARVTFAPYAAHRDVAGWIAVAGEGATTPSQRWLRRHHADGIVTQASDPQTALALARAGVGQVVLPCFAAEGDPGVVRTGPVIEALTHEEWLVCHHDARQDPAVRTALEAIATVLCNRELRPG
jgi:DNA-binding transcriptional LysR family regulator